MFIELVAKLAKKEQLTAQQTPAQQRQYKVNTSCARGDTICPAPLLPRRAPPSRRNVAVLSHAEYVPTLAAAAALHVKAALSKAAW